MAEVLFPPDLSPVSPEAVELIDDATQMFAPTLARGLTQRISFGDPRWRINRKYTAVRAEDKARLTTVMQGARGRFITVRTTPGYVQRGSFPSQELFTNPTFANGTTGWTAETAWNQQTVKDKVMRSQRTIGLAGAFFLIPSGSLSGLTPYAPYIARFFVRHGSAYDPSATVLRIDDYGVLAGTAATFKSMARGVITPRSSSARPAIAMTAPTVMVPDGASYIECAWASFARCCLVDTGANLIPLSDTFSDASWAKAHATVGVNVTTAPDGTTTADSLIEDATAASDHVIATGNLAVSSSSILEVTATAYLKANTRTWALLCINETLGPSKNIAYFNLATGAVGTVGNGTNMVETRAAITALGNGWYRCSITGRKSNAATSVSLQVGLAQGDGIGSYDGNGTNSIFVWRAGMTPGSQPSIPVQTSAASSPGQSFQAGHINAKGLPLSTAGLLLAGDYIEINGELKRVTAAVNSDASGNGVIHFRPGMVFAPADNDPIVIGNPMGRFVASDMKWDSQWGLQEDATVTLDEVYE